MINQDKPTNRIQRLPVEHVATEEQTDPYGLYPMQRVISPIIPVVVRQDGLGNPAYQEALGYSFLVNSMRFPRIVQLDDGRLILKAAAALHPGYIEDPINYVDDPIILFSSDEGQSWTAPQPAPGHGQPTLVNLGGEKLMLHGGNEMWFTDDAGQTWSDAEPVPPLSDGRDSHGHGTMLVEGDVVSAISYVEEERDGDWLKGDWTARSVLRRFHLDSRSWDPPHFFPATWRTSEGSLTRAQNGNLVAAFRTGRPGIPVHADHQRGISTSVSTDNGETWSDPAIQFLYGHHHMELLPLPDGRILMTYAARIGELEGRSYHGAEAVLSHDHGHTWDWDHRYIIFRWYDQGMHSPQSIRLSDGRILTIFMHGWSYSWNNRDPHAPWDAGKWQGGMNFIGHVSVVIWSLD